MAHVIAGKTLAVREELGQTAHLVESRLGSRQATLRLRQKLSLAVDHLHAESARVGVAVHKGETLRKGVVLHHRIRVEKQHILARRDADGLVVGPAEAHILLIGDDLHLGKLLRQHLQRAVNRVVVDDKHLPLNALQGATHRIQALLEEVLDVIVNDDNREFHTSRDHLSGLES